MELPSWAGALHVNMLKVLDIVELREGRLMELGVQNTGMFQETMDDFKDMDTCGKCSLHAPKERWKTMFATGQIWIQSVEPVVSHFDPTNGADRSVADSRVGNQRRSTPQDSRRCRIPAI